MNKMKKEVLMMTTAAVTLSAVAWQLIDYADSVIGTNGMGHIFPGACTPSGWVQPNLDTGTIPHSVNGAYQKNAYECCTGCQHWDKTIVGLSRTHLSDTGHSDPGDILLTFAVDDVELNPGRADHPEEGYCSRFDHATEKAAPGYYEAMLDGYGIKTQLTATRRTGVHKYTFPKGKDGHLVLDLVHGIYNYDGKVLQANLWMENNTLLTGYRITDGWTRTNCTYFAISLSQPIKDYGYKDKEEVLYSSFWCHFKLEKNFPEIIGRKIVAHFSLEAVEDSGLVVKVALLAVSTGGAVKNLRAEASGKSFEQLVEVARTDWSNELDHFEIGGTPDQKTMFYTSPYHTVISPSMYTDVDGPYRGLDRNIHQAKEFINYTTFSFWDTYHAEHPFLNLMKPECSADMVESTIKHEQQGVYGMLPIWSLVGNENWCMSSYHTASVLADAITRGVFSNMDEVLSAMVSISTVPYYEGVADYMKLGYIPLDKGGTTTSSMLEYAYDNWTVYQTTLRTGNREIADTYRKCALSYRNIYDTNIGFARPRYNGGTSKERFDVLQTYDEGFTEGNSWNFPFHAPHDVLGMIDLMGGEKTFVRKLDELFSMHPPEKYYGYNGDITEECLVGGYVYGNEPSHHVPYSYTWTSQPQKTQCRLREILNKMYRNSINGLDRNDDCKQMSAWYLFSMMGFYPVCPGTDQYVLGAPCLSYLKLTLPSGKTLEIKAPGASDKRRHIQLLKLNGESYDKMYITHEDILEGGVLGFRTSASPNKHRGVSIQDKPYSLTNGIN